jgi:uncharacterized membrane protein
MASPKGRPASRSARTTAAISATPTSRAASRPAVKAADPEPAEDELLEPAETRPAGQPLWLQIVTFALAILGLVISIYETWAEEFNSSHLAGCSVKPGGTFDCGAVLTSPQSHVFGIPVAVLGVLFYVVAVPLFSPWAWRLRRREVHVLRLASAVVGMGFVMYLIYAELYQVGQVCEYCTGVHIVTFLLFCITVFSAAIWGLGGQREPADLD